LCFTKQKKFESIKFENRIIVIVIIVIAPVVVVVVVVIAARLRGMACSDAPDDQSQPNSKTYSLLAHHRFHS
jgi:flagellar basal body-associated protein FliL